MAQEEQKGITVKKEEDFSEWYSQVVQKAELADYSQIKGFMIIRPNAYSIWEKIRSYFDKRIKALGVRNAYFPLLIPESFFKKEAEHAEGFEPELAWVNRTDDDTERLAIRPTSETIMYDSYSKWIRSHRDLPLRINQWCNVLRWEVKQTKPFLRTREFLWQEGHCVYETKEECEKEVKLILDEYQRLCERMLAVPVIAGKKTKSETFAGAEYSLCIESYMPDGKAIQMGTSHNLGQGFAKAFGISFLGKDEKPNTPWQSSWGVSTRLIGSIIMAHGDDNGMIIPPKVAENKLVIVPIYFKDKEKVSKKAKELAKKLSKYNPILDDRDEYKPGFKFNEWELKGIPLRVEIGPRDIEKKQVVLVRRDNGEKVPVKLTKLNEIVDEVLEDIQKSLFERAKKVLEKGKDKASEWKDFVKKIKDKKIVLAPSCLEPECDEIIKDETGGATPRCVPFEQKKIEGEKCIKCGKEAKAWVYFNNGY
ncbi:MAG: proline--tRNA ligase [Candidatus Woesearchaeota archaeon]|jgi:prolyl-tRNA synthetase|nr:proline--tRNA ligase [Candidatus Woesearchaeota archaeon]MDP7610198.1 proline--tRNA ligase [Candidatus Woesearchaeota archaeon]|tara:strand:+ start:2335 stop:3771 length:1437 start_codon:yes stop_codon:yes gene_type:complete